MHIPRSPAYKQLWRVVDEAVADALNTHPDYLTEKGRRNARASITKRVVGNVLGFAEQSARGRSTASVAAESKVAPANVGRHRWRDLFRAIRRAACGLVARHRGAAS